METCSICGEPLTIVGRVISRQGSQTKSQRVQQMRARAGAIQEEARISSDARMAEFVEIDRQRIEREHEQSYARQLRDRQLFRNVAIGLGLFLLFVAIVTLVILL
jgi:Fe2+ transport system protein B